MKMIIDIPDELIEKIKNSLPEWGAKYVAVWDATIRDAIKNGTPCDDMFNIVKNACSIQKLSEERVEDIKRDVWQLYEKHQSHLATHVLEFGDELKELLGKYQKGGDGE